MEKTKESEGLKYEILLEQSLTLEGRPKLFRIRALKDLPNKGIQKGDFGGWVEDNDSLSQEDDCWIGELAMVYGGSTVKGFALVTGRADISGKSIVMDHAVVKDNAAINNVCVKDCVTVSEYARVSDSILKDFADVQGCAEVNKSELREHASAFGHANITDSELSGDTSIGGDAAVTGCVFEGECVVNGEPTLGSSTFRERVTIGGTANITSSDLRGSIIINGDAEIHHCSEIYGRYITINQFANLYEDNYMVVSPIAEVPCVIFYRSGLNVLCSVNNEVYDNPNELIVYLTDNTRIPARRLRKLVSAFYQAMDD